MWGVGIVTALLTAFYMMRVVHADVRRRVALAAWRKPSSRRSHPGRSRFLCGFWAILSLVAGFVGIPGVIAHGEWNWIHHFLGEPYGGPVAESVLPAHGESFLAIEWALIGLGSAIAIIGLWIGWRVYSRDGLAYDAKLSARFGRLYQWWQGKYFWDEFYERTVVGPVVGGAHKLWAPFDQYIVDGVVNGVGYVTRGTGQLLRYVQTGRVQNYATAIVLGVVLVVALMLFG